MPAALFVAGEEGGSFKGARTEGAGEKLVAGLGDSGEWHTPYTPILTKPLIR